MGKVSVKTLRGALHPTALHWSSFPNQQTTAPVLCSLSFKEHEVSVDRGRFGKNETFHKQKLGGLEENAFVTVKTTAEKLDHGIISMKKQFTLEFLPEVAHQKRGQLLNVTHRSSVFFFLHKHLLFLSNE